MKSMTGFGAGAVAVADGRIVVEVRSVNARFLDLKLALPREYQAAEGEFREMLQAAIERGRVDVSVRREAGKRGRPKLEVDLDLARAHADAWRSVQRALGLGGNVDLLLLRASAGDIVRAVEPGADPARDLPALRRALKRALEAHVRDRAREGAHLKADMERRLRALDGVRRECERHGGDMREILTERLTNRIAGLLGSAAPDPGRILQEVVIALERSDFSEELTRLASHVQAFRRLLRERSAVGKRIEFLLQEMLREVNTVGSKANHLAVTEAVLVAKGELEKLREQAANVE
ncbi:MAG TPA: YicC/YloC family endoribonuclease [Candidatus Binatia bacterium]|nr:YicC/YloC family endoribonuclease [Candidatus Binatia bacterium]